MLPDHGDEVVFALGLWGRAHGVLAASAPISSDYELRLHGGGLGGSALKVLRQCWASSDSWRAWASSFCAILRLGLALVGALQIL
jgi:hypothetical protein